MGEILADFSVQNPTLDSLSVGLNVKRKRSQASLAQLVERIICNDNVVGSIPTGGSKFLIMSMFISYYIVCVIYCFYQLFKNLSKRYSNDPTGGSPELDTIMVIMMAWVLAPVDVSLTWIKWYKDAEIVKRRQEKIF